MIYLIIQEAARKIWTYINACHKNKMGGAIVAVETNVNVALYHRENNSAFDSGII